ncbi:MAG: hypothetical protein H7Y11_07110, partial [Armatimonadetes bacterium]|nr:hypothetical protein [Anaerolineae bacterium]
MRNVMLCVLMSTALLTSAPFDCPSAPASRLSVGSSRRVTPGDANNLRAEPNSGATLLGKIPGGDSFAVIGGPVCGEAVVASTPIPTAILSTREPTPAVLPSATPIPHAGAGDIYFWGIIADSDGVVVFTPTLDPTTYTTLEIGLYRVPAQGGAVTEVLRHPFVTHNYTSYQYPDGLFWTPDGSAFLSTWRVAEDQWQIVSFDLATLDYTVLVSSPHRLRYPLWSPDGTSIIYTETVSQTGSYSVGSHNLISINADGGNPRALTNDTTERTFP